MSSSPTPAPKARLQPLLLWLVWLLLLLSAAWRAELAFGILLRPGLPEMRGSAVVHWRRLDELLPWLSLALFLLGDAAARSLRQARETRILGAAVFLGAILTALSVALDQANLTGPSASVCAFAGALLMLLIALVLAAREARGILRALKPAGGSPGITIIDLWRFAAAQWALLMAAAIFWIIASKSKEDRLGNELVHTLVFFLPAAAMLPNTLMAAGISLWNDILLAAGSTLAHPRVRAWVVAFLALQAGPAFFLLSLLPRLHMPWAIIPAAAFEWLGIGFYLAGFPTSAWRDLGGKLHLAAWICFAIALAAALVERIYTMNDQPMSIYYSSAWRHLWSTGTITLWCIALGTQATTLLISPTRTARLGGLIAILTAAGLVATLTVQLLTAAQVGEAQVPVMHFLIFGTTLTLAAVVAILAGLLTPSSKARPSPL